MGAFPTIPFWVDRFRSGTAHLDDAQVGLYLRLLMLIWDSPNCKIPNEDGWIAHKLNRTPELFRPLIREFCKSDGNWITQKKLFKEWKWVKEKGRIGRDAAKARWDKEKDVSGRNAGAMPPHPYPNPLEKKDLISSISGGKKNGKVTILDAQERLNRFQKTLAEAMGRDGYSIVGAAADPSNPLYMRSVALCQAKAKELGKGWPHQWPK